MCWKWRIWHTLRDSIRVEAALSGTYTMAELKTQLNEANVNLFLGCIADLERREDCFELVSMMKDITGCEPRMWGTAIVGFGEYHYVYASGREGDWPIIGFSPRAQNISVYIMSGFSGYDALMAKLGKHKTGKSCLYIKRLSDVDQSVLRKLAEKSVAFMRQKYACT